MSSITHKLTHEVVSRLHAMEVSLSMLDAMPMGIKAARIVKYLEFLASDTARALEHLPNILEAQFKAIDPQAQRVSLCDELETIAHALGKIIDFPDGKPKDSSISTYAQHLRILLHTLMLNMKGGETYFHPITAKTRRQEDALELDIAVESAPYFLSRSLEDHHLKNELDLIIIESLVDKLADKPAVIQRQQSITRLSIRIKNQEVR